MTTSVNPASESSLLASPAVNGVPPMSAVCQRVTSVSTPHARSDTRPSSSRSATASDARRSARGKGSTPTIDYDGIPSARAHVSAPTPTPTSRNRAPGAFNRCSRSGSWPKRIGNIERTKRPEAAPWTSSVSSSCRAPLPSQRPMSASPGGAGRRTVRRRRGRFRHRSFRGVEGCGGIQPEQQPRRRSLRHRRQRRVDDIGRYLRVHQLRAGPRDAERKGDHVLDRGVGTTAVRAEVRAPAWWVPTWSRATSRPRRATRPTTPCWCPSAASTAGTSH